MADCAPISITHLRGVEQQDDGGDDGNRQSKQCHKVATSEAHWKILQVP